jgi:hypothetical protein
MLALKLNVRDLIVKAIPHCSRFYGAPSTVFVAHIQAIAKLAKLFISEFLKPVDH